VFAKLSTDRNVLEQGPVATEDLLADEIGEDAPHRETQHSAQRGAVLAEQHEYGRDREPQLARIRCSRHASEAAIEGRMYRPAVDPFARCGIHPAHPRGQQSPSKERDLRIAQRVRHGFKPRREPRS
jgi:hypothetical protein